MYTRYNVPEGLVNAQISGLYTTGSLRFPGGSAVAALETTPQQPVAQKRVSQCCQISKKKKWKYEFTCEMPRF